MLIIKIEELPFSSFFSWKWKAEDYKKPISFLIEDAKIDVYFKEDEFNNKRKYSDRIWIMNCSGVISIENPPSEILNGLKKTSQSEEKRAKDYILRISNEANNKFVLYSRMFLGLENVLEDSIKYRDLFHKGLIGGDKPNISWSIDKKNFYNFLPTVKRERKINPLFKSKNLLNSSALEKLRGIALKNTAISKEIEELFKLKSKVAWNERRIPTVEAAALIEVKLRNKIQELAQARGVSANKLKKSEDDVGLSILINLLLPLVLTKKENTKFKKHIENLDKLRKIRNNIMHSNLENEKIKKEDVYNGIASAIKVITLLEKK